MTKKPVNAERVKRRILVRMIGMVGAASPPDGLREEVLNLCDGDHSRAEDIIAETIKEVGGIGEPLPEGDYGQVEDLIDLLYSGKATSTSSPSVVLDVSVIPTGDRCYTQEASGTRTRCPYLRDSDHGVVYCDYLGKGSLIGDDAREYLKALKHFGSEAALEKATQLLLLWDATKECGIKECGEEYL